MQYFKRAGTALASIVWTCGYMNKPMKKNLELDARQCSRNLREKENEQPCTVLVLTKLEHNLLTNFSILRLLQKAYTPGAAGFSLLPK